MQNNAGFFLEKKSVELRLSVIWQKNNPASFDWMSAIEENEFKKEIEGKAKNR